MKRLFVLLFLICFCLPLQAQWLQQSTATSVTLWLFNTADSTPKTGVTVTTITVRYVKSDGTTASFSPTASAGSNDMVEKGNGAYFQELTAAQLDTAGPFDIGCSVSGGVCAATVYQVLPAASYALVAGGNVASSSDLWNVATGSVTAGIGLQVKTNLDQPVSSSGGVITTGVAQAGAANTITLAASAPAISLVNKRIVITAGTGAFQSGLITAYNTGTRVATVMDSSTGGNWTTQPASGSTYVIHDASVGALVDNILTAAKVAADTSTEFATTFFGTVIEGTHTLKQSMQYLNSAMVGKYNSSAGTFNFRDLGDTKNRIVYTTTATSRATVTLSPD